MSKESKSRDRFRQSIEAIRDRPSEFCPGCGYYRAINDHHRADCTAKESNIRGRNSTTNVANGGGGQ